MWKTADVDFYDRRNEKIYYYISVNLDFKKFLKFPFNLI